MNVVKARAVMVADAPLALVTHAAQKGNSPAEFIAYAKASAKPLDYGSIGTGSSQHLAMEQLRTAAGVAMNPIPYKGGALALNDVLSQQRKYGPLIRALNIRPQ